MNQTVKSPSGRVKRQPVGTRNRLTLKGKEPGYEYRIVADRSNNISALQEQGYEFVPADKITVGDSRVNQAPKPGEHATISLGAGETGYVMRIQEDWYKDDQAAKRAEVQATLDSMKRVNKADGDYGKISIGRGA
jgi:hypothetical protein